MRSNQISIQKIVLIGFRGAGKTTLAHLLARELQWEYFSTDRAIEQSVNLSIPEIVARHGWDFFRQKEAEIIQQVASRKRIVIDCGGGVVENSRNMERLRPGALVVWVDAPLAELKQRLRQAGNRPLLNQPDFDRDVEENYRRRLPLYRNYANLRINTSEESPEGAISRILSRLPDRSDE